MDNAALNHIARHVNYLSRYSGDFFTTEAVDHVKFIASLAHYIIVKERQIKEFLALLNIEENRIIIATRFKCPSFYDLRSADSTRNGHYTARHTR